MFVSIRKRLPCVVRTAAAIVVTLSFALPGLPVHAQSTDADAARSMTPDELEAYIAAQREELEKVIENRKITESKAEALEQALEERQAKQREVEAEVQALCEQREAIEPGSMSTCLKESEG